MYEDFSDIYDHVMEHIPYEEWFKKLHGYLKEKGISDGVICELGCGTGTMTELFAKAGYRMIGVDESPDMLALAQMKKAESGLDILYVEQSMEELTLAEPVDAIISVCDSMNYLLLEEQLLDTFLNAKKYLKKGGYMIFDLKTAYCYQEVIGNRTWVEQDDEVSYIWDNYFHEDRYINEYVITVFRKKENAELYEKIEEVHYQRAYTPDEIKRQVDNAGLTFVDVLDGDLKSKPGDKSERYYIVVRA